MNAGRSEDVRRLDIGIEGVPLQRLIQAQVQFLGLLREVSSSVVGDSDDVRWIVTEVVAEGVDLLVRPESARAQLPIAAIREIPAVVAAGMGAIEAKAVRPRHFNDEALGYARDLRASEGQRDNQPGGTPQRNGDCYHEPNRGERDGSPWANHHGDWDP